MKKMFFALIGFSFLGLSAVNAQPDTKKVTKTISAVDTITFSSIGSNLVALQYTFTETGGTTAGKVILEGTVNGTWKGIDSLTLADNTTAQTLYKEFTTTGYLNYRFRNTNTSAATGTAVAAFLRRPDERR